MAYLAAPPLLTASVETAARVKCDTGIYFLVSGSVSFVNVNVTGFLLANLVPVAPCLNCTVLSPVKSGEPSLYFVQSSFSV